MKIKTIKIEEAIPYVRNPRQNKAAIAKVSASLKEFGWQQPIVVDKDMVVIAGHTRLEAARTLGMDKVPVQIAEDLTDAQVKAYRIADNRVSQEAEWDLDLLRLELSDLDNLDYDLLLTGFDDDELNCMLTEAVEGFTDEDDVPELPDEPVSVLGDIWTLGNHRLMCGDSTSVDEVEKLMDGQRAQICFTSPPYNVGSMNIKGNERTKEKYKSYNDKKNDDDFYDFLNSNLSCMMNYSDEIFYNIGLVQNNKKTIFKIVNDFSDVFKDIIYWKKSNVAPHIQKGVINNLVEFILCFGDDKRKFKNAQFSQGSYYNVIEGSGASGNEFSDIHKATFPIYLPENIINNFTSPNSNVIDCFGGTGTTLIACEKTGRQCRMMELDKVYVDVIINRWQDFTGKEAVHAETGKTYNEMKAERDGVK